MVTTQRYTDTTTSANNLEIIVTTQNVIVRCNSECEECQFSIADELGRVLKKGILTDETLISFEGISPGFYLLIVFNENDRFTYPIKIN